ncbi:Peptide deformylase [bioreactor metagenome]|jgi:peptide deformylase|uniref:Peptide deformylase n=2 Tax=root TaxID=1 RepID=A0A562J9L7_9FIRM|nr:peptide deformylase [Sedimentibacter saalensis]MEA5095862.1 peptide deformylase [Sedimentibacter saalensis]TWH79918.1 peptide deformylase [Sedimentibacter saalensis]
MALRNLRFNGDEILRKRSREVSVIDNKIKMLLNDMLDTMYENDGVGLAAPQVGILKRVVTIDVDDGNIYKMINPKIIKSSGEQTDQEGCLSVPETKGMVKRPMNVTAVYTDEDGNEVTVEAEGLLARAICHEIDHLDGVLFIDRTEK